MGEADISLVRKVHIPLGIENGHSVRGRRMRFSVGAAALTIVLGAVGIAADAKANVQAEDSLVYAYCTAQELPSRQWYTTKVFTIRVDGLQLGGEVPSQDILIASYTPNDLNGQFVDMVEKAGLNRGSANCFAAGTMADLESHYERAKSRITMQKGKFAEWDPEGGFFISSELWPN